jgi:hypothetical protein
MTRQRADESLQGKDFSHDKHFTPDQRAWFLYRDRTIDSGDSVLFFSGCDCGDALAKADQADGA